MMETIEMMKTIYNLIKYSYKAVWQQQRYLFDAFCVRGVPGFSFRIVVGNLAFPVRFCFA